MVVESGNYYPGALKGNRDNLLRDVEIHFVCQQMYTDISKGHGLWEKRVVNLCQQPENIKPCPGLKRLVQVESERRLTVDKSFVPKRHTTTGLFH